MNGSKELCLEVLSGPLDGSRVVLEDTIEWGASGAGPLSFPWDEALGTPQARFVPGEEGWVLEGIKSPHGMYCLNRQERITTGRMVLEPDDILKASNTWLLVRGLDQGGEP
ncbi:MAG: hypothetical protein JXA37_13375 [Chloroflexia bacterium]|nr:hypothetical protein [Chloroflexia bacterium]